MQAHRCDACTKKIVKHKPSLICNICNNISHYQCNKLTKSDATYIIETSHNWTCIKCTANLFPLGLFSDSGQTTTSTRCLTTELHKNCSACTKRLGPHFNICSWCEKPCHMRCTKGQLGCIRCANEIIPGFNYSNVALMGITTNLNDKIYNPFDHRDILNDVHTIGIDDMAEATYWQEASQCLLQCNYKQHKTIPHTKHDELKLMSLNVRSLQKHITEIRDEYKQYEKFDILCFNETCCNPENAPGGVLDFEIEGFHPPILQKPARNSSRGGGLAIYLRENLCSPDDYHTLENLSSNNSPSQGEFLFI